MESFFVKAAHVKCDRGVKAVTTLLLDKEIHVVTLDSSKLTIRPLASEIVKSEVQFAERAPTSMITTLETNLDNPAIIILVVKNQKSIIAFDENLRLIETLVINTQFNIVSMCISQKDGMLFISGSFGQLEAFRFMRDLSWKKAWSKHESSQWVANLNADEEGQILFGSSGLEIFMCHYNGGDRAKKFESTHTMEITDVKFSAKHFLVVTASSDGSIRTWAVVHGKIREVDSVKIPKCGPVKIALDKDSIFALSQERVIRRFTIEGLKLNSEFSLDSGSNNITPKICTRGDSSTVLVAEIGYVQEYTVHALPREISSLRSNAQHVCSNEAMKVFTLCDENLLHTVATNGEQDMIDLQSVGITTNVIGVCATGNTFACILNTGSAWIFNVETYEKHEFVVGCNLFSVKVHDVKFPSHICSSTSACLAICCEEGVACFCLDCLKFVACLRTNAQILYSECFDGKVIGLAAGSLNLWNVREDGAKISLRRELRTNGDASVLKVISNEYVAVGTAHGSVYLYSLTDFSEVCKFSTKCYSRIITMGWFDLPILRKSICCCNVDGVLFELEIGSGELLVNKEIPLQPGTFCACFNDKTPCLVMGCCQSALVMDAPVIQVSTENMECIPHAAMESQKIEVRVEKKEPIRSKISPQNMTCKERKSLDRSMIAKLTAARAVQFQIPGEEQAAKNREHDITRRASLPTTRTVLRDSVDLVMVDGKPRLKFNKTNEPQFDEPQPEIDEPDTEQVMELEPDPEVIRQSIDFVEESINFNIGKRRPSTSTRRSRREPLVSTKRMINESEFYNEFLSMDIRHAAKTPTSGTRCKSDIVAKARGQTSTATSRKSKEEILQIFKMTTPSRRKSIAGKQPMVDQCIPRIVNTAAAQPKSESSPPIVRRYHVRPSTAIQRDTAHILSAPVPVPTTTPVGEVAPAVVVEEEKQPPAPKKFSKKSFIAKLDAIPTTTYNKGGVTFANGKVLPSLRTRAEPNLDVIGTILHPEYAFNFFTVKGKEKSDLDGFTSCVELFYDLMDPSVEAIQRLLRESPQLRARAMIYGGEEDQLDLFLYKTPPMSRADIDEVHRRSLKGELSQSALDQTSTTFPVVDRVPLQNRVDCAIPETDETFEELPSESETHLFRYFIMY